MTRRKQKRRCSKSLGHMPRVNTKALFTVAMTVTAFTGMVLPAFILILSLASTQPQLSNSPALQLVTCVTVASSFAVFPFLNVIADKEMKEKVVQLLKRALDRGELDSDTEELVQIAQESNQKD